MTPNMFSLMTDMSFYFSCLLYIFIVLSALFFSVPESSPFFFSLVATYKTAFHNSSSPYIFIPPFDPSTYAGK